MDKLILEILNKLGGVKHTVKVHEAEEYQPSFIDFDIDWEDLRKDLQTEYGKNVGEWLHDFLDQNCDELETALVRFYGIY